MLIAATGTVFPILFKSPNKNLQQEQLNFILRKWFRMQNSLRPPFQYGKRIYYSIKFRCKKYNFVNSENLLRILVTFRLLIIYLSKRVCLYLCWGTMLLYGIGSSLYIFTACLLCCEKRSTMKQIYQFRVIFVLGLKSYTI
jgi:hypothetical protein